MNAWGMYKHDCMYALRIWIYLHMLSKIMRDAQNLLEQHLEHQL